MKKKLEIPKKLRVGGIDYTIKAKNVFKNDRGAHWGFHSYTEANIKILLKDNGETLASCSVLASLFHEVCHAVDYVYGHAELEEGIIERLSDLFFQLLSDNNFYIGENKLPKSIKILGKTYKVVKNYDFQDCREVPSISVNPTSLEIRYAESSNNHEITCIGTLECIFHIICNASFFTEEEQERIDTKSFCTGVYQVLKDSKLDRLIREWC